MFRRRVKRLLLRLVLGLLTLSFRTSLASWLLVGIFFAKSLAPHNKR